MNEPRLVGHAMCKWPNQIRWNGRRNVTTALRGFGCECGVDFRSDDPYTEHDLHLMAVTSALRARRWTEVFTGAKNEVRKTADRLAAMEAVVTAARSVIANHGGAYVADPEHIAVRRVDLTALHAALEATEGAP